MCKRNWKKLQELQSCRGSRAPIITPERESLQIQKQGTLSVNMQANRLLSLSAPPCTFSIPLNSFASLSPNSFPGFSFLIRFTFYLHFPLLNPVLDGCPACYSLYSCTYLVSSYFLLFCSFLTSSSLPSLPASLIPVNSPVSFLTPYRILFFNFFPSCSDYFSAVYALCVHSLLSYLLW